MERYKIQASSIYSLGYALLIFVLSIIIIPFYIEGDQLHYKLIYEEMYLFYDLLEAYEYYFFILNANEIIHFLLIYYLSTYVDRHIFIASLNGALSYFISKWMFANKVNPFIIFFTIFNYYMWILYIPAERLKLGALILLIALSSKALLSVRGSKYIVYILSILSHFQILILISSIELGKVTSRLAGKLSSNRDLINLILFVLSVLIIGIYYFEELVAKVEYYRVNYGGVHGVVKPLVFLIGSIYCAKKSNLRILIMFIPILLMSILVGAERVTIMAYILFMYYGLQYKKGLNIPVIISTLYYTAKGLLFLDTAIQYGDGFYED